MITKFQRIASTANRYNHSFPGLVMTPIVMTSGVYISIKKLGEFEVSHCGELFSFEQLEGMTLNAIDIRIGMVAKEIL